MEIHQSDELVSQAPGPRLAWLQPKHIPGAWPVIEPLLQKGCAESRGEFNVDMILANLEHWPILVIIRGQSVQAVMVCGVSVLANGKRRLDCLLASGEDAKEWAAVDDEFDAFARDLGCNSVYIPRARKGWARALPHWKIVGYAMERDI